MTDRKEMDDVEELADDLTDRCISLQGEIRGLDEVIDEILNKRGDRQRRRFAVG